MNVLILGSGGREHTLAWKIAQSKLLTKLYIAPGNAGTALVGNNIKLALNNFEQIKKFCINNNINMIVIGPEQPLVDGFYDYIKSDLETATIKIIGLAKEAAQLEGSKDYAKDFMKRHGIPTAAYSTFTSKNISSGYKFLEKLQPPYVLKVDGLAAGKGVLIINDLDETKVSLNDILINKRFGDAGNKVVIEEYLHGIELSVFVLTDGKNYIILPEAKDYKRIGDGDTGLNTGGMGSISPVPFVDETLRKKIEENIIKPTIKGLSKDNLEYNGFVFIGLMNVDGEPKVIEYNVRMGDPETESVIPRIKNDLLEIFDKTCTNKLSEVKLDIDSRFIATVMLVSGGYPESYENGKIISGLENINNSIVFHAGTNTDNKGNIITAGGRVLTVTSYGETIEHAIESSYLSAQKIHFENAYYRLDIGKDLI